MLNEYNSRRIMFTSFVNVCITVAMFLFAASFTPYWTAGGDNFVAEMVTIFIVCLYVVIEIVLEVLLLNHVIKPNLSFIDKTGMILIAKGFLVAVFWIIMMQLNLAQALHSNWMVFLLLVPGLAVLRVPWILIFND